MPSKISAQPSKNPVIAAGLIPARTNCRRFIRAKFSANNSPRRTSEIAPRKRGITPYTARRERKRLESLTMRGRLRNCWRERSERGKNS
jgi:hypothetical protein